MLAPPVLKNKKKITDISEIPEISAIFFKREPVS
jgi:hypothetical protein